MSLRKDPPCDLDGICPYESGEYCSCEYWCGADEPQDDPEAWWGEEDGFPPVVADYLDYYDPVPEECDSAECPEAEDDFWMQIHHPSGLRTVTDEAEILKAWEMAWEVVKRKREKRGQSATP